MGLLNSSRARPLRSEPSIITYELSTFNRGNDLGLVRSDQRVAGMALRTAHTYTCAAPFVALPCPPILFWCRRPLFRFRLFFLPFFLFFFSEAGLAGYVLATQTLFLRTFTFTSDELSTS
ncbi:hypothetical protein PENSPDRAFT_359768 [Peniophora sp. CONT]|nr:hypothetical protein PENSPDRAFT_359768 [Peniophora sp. CONT]